MYKETNSSFSTIEKCLLEFNAEYLLTSNKFITAYRIMSSNFVKLLTGLLRIIKINNNYHYHHRFPRVQDALHLSLYCEI